MFLQPINFETVGEKLFALTIRVTETFMDTGSNQQKQLTSTATVSIYFMCSYTHI